MSNIDYLQGKQFYALRTVYKIKSKRCKYLGQEQVYHMTDKIGISINRIPLNLKKDFIDKIEHLEYIGMYDTGINQIPLFKER